MCQQYTASAHIMHEEARSAEQNGFVQLAEVATQLAHEYDEFIRIACSGPA